MSQQKREKPTATTPEKIRSQQPKVQLEGKLTQAQLEAIGFASARSAIAGGFDGGETGNHNQSLVSLKEGIMSPPPPEKPLEGKLTQEQLEAIAAAGRAYQ